MPITFEIEDDELLREWYEKGRIEGLNEYRNEGRLEALATILRVQLPQKFGPLTPAHEDRINGATYEELEVWILRVLPATSIDEIFN